MYGPFQEYVYPLSAVIERYNNIVEGQFRSFRFA